MSIIIKHTELKHYVGQVQELLKHKVDATNPNGLLEHLSELCNLASNIPLMTASAKYYLEEKKKEQLPIAATKGMTPQLTKEYATSLCSAELSIYELIQEYGSEIDKRRNAMISMLSYERKLMEMANMQPR